jgi:uncharacterized protein (DUF362 family)
MSEILIEIISSYNEYDRIKEFVEKAVEIFEPDLPQEFIIKPNFLKFSNPEEGCITHPLVVKAVVEVLKDYGSPVVAEGGFGKDDAERVFDAFSMREWAECINLNECEFVRIKVKGKALKSVEISKPAYQLAAGKPFISLPKLKVHHLVKATLGIKNNMGFLKKPAIFMHPGINTKLVDLLSVFRPALTIIDGIIGGEGYEGNAKPVRHGVMIAGDDVVACDAVGAYLMGLDPMDIGYLRQAFERGSGEVRIEEIEFIGEKPELLRKKYRFSTFSRVLGFLRI